MADQLKRGPVADLVHRKNDARAEVTLTNTAADVLDYHWQDDRRRMVRVMFRSADGSAPKHELALVVLEPGEFLRVTCEPAPPQPPLVAHYDWVTGAGEDDG